MSSTDDCLPKKSSVVVEYNINPENATMEEWLHVWKGRADDAFHCEPETLAVSNTRIQVGKSNLVSENKRCSMKLVSIWRSKEY